MSEYLKTNEAMGNLVEIAEFLPKELAPKSLTPDELLQLFEQSVAQSDKKRRSPFAGVTSLAKGHTRLRHRNTEQLTIIPTENEGFVALRAEDIANGLKFALGFALSDKPQVEGILEQIDHFAAQTKSTVPITNKGLILKTSRLLRRQNIELSSLLESELVSLQEAKQRAEAFFAQAQAFAPLVAAGTRGEQGAALAEYQVKLMYYITVLATAIFLISSIVGCTTGPSNVSNPAAVTTSETTADNSNTGVAIETGTGDASPSSVIAPYEAKNSTRSGFTFYTTDENGATSTFVLNPEGESGYTVTYEDNGTPVTEPATFKSTGNGGTFYHQTTEGDKELLVLSFDSETNQYIIEAHYPNGVTTVNRSEENSPFIKTVNVAASPQEEDAATQPQITLTREAETSGSNIDQVSFSAAAEAGGQLSFPLSYNPETGQWIMSGNTEVTMVHDENINVTHFYTQDLSNELLKIDWETQNPGAIRVTFRLPGTEGTIYYGAEQNLPSDSSGAQTLRTLVTTAHEGSSVTAPATETTEPATEEQGSEEAPTQEAFPANYVQAIEAAGAQLPMYAEAFTELRNTEYPPFVYLPDQNGEYKRHYLETEANISFELRSDNELWAVFRFENEPDFMEMRWFPVEKAGVEIPGYWAVKQFGTSLVSMYLGFDAFNMEQTIKSKRQISVRLPDIASVELEANTDLHDPNESDYFGETREDVLEYFSQGGYNLPEDFLLVEPPYNHLDVEAAYNKPVFHTFANVLFGTQNATPEQIAAVSAYYHGTASPEQKTIVESTQQFAANGKLAVSVNSPEGTKVWDLSNPESSPINYVIMALPFEGEATQNPVLQDPLTIPVSSTTITESGQAVVRIFHDSSWIRLLTMYITDLAQYLGIPKTGERYDYLEQSYVYAQQTNDQGKTVITPLSLTRETNP